MQTCHICSSDLKKKFEKVTDAETGETFAIWFCENCKLGQTHPQPEDLSKYYSNYYGDRHGATAEFRARRRLRLLKKSFEYSKSKSVLDIGCGDGAFLEKARDSGWKSIGTELNSNFETDLEIYSDLLKVEKKYGKNSFDAITLWHVLEHFKEPKEVLKQANELLKDDGRLLIAVPNAAGLQARFSGKKWLHLDAPRHLFHFSYFALEKILNETGFKILRSWHQEFEYDLLGWSQSALNIIFAKPNVFFKTLSKKDKGIKKNLVFSHFVLGTLFSAIALPLVPIGTLQKKGGTIVVRVAKR